VFPFLWASGQFTGQNLTYSEIVRYFPGATGVTLSEATRIMVWIGVPRHGKSSRRGILSESTTESGASCPGWQIAPGASCFIYELIFTAGEWLWCEYFSVILEFIMVNVSSSEDAWGGYFLIN
jgi:hypothetical protein